ncbi:MAG TPA: antitoxin [Smithellaceae bacterium]|jgi:antitoxin (DNA-binding transcriptional repressor) of toxin-antitoxin stability system|nr:antitoxin [Smithellaceae bacterium]HQM44487.1 antitoxin [Smithellaceae bacterium]
MMKTISATDAVRTFSELLNAIKYRGELYTIIRGGKPAATIGPVETVTSMRTLKELALLMKTMPRLDDDDQFSADVEGVIANQPTTPEGPSWE